MKKKVLIALVVLLTLAAIASLVMASPAAGAFWSEKVTGGLDYYGSTVRSRISVSAMIDPATGDVKGQMEYWRMDNGVRIQAHHGTVTTMCSGPDGDAYWMILAGPMFMQEYTRDFTPLEYMAVYIWDHPDGDCTRLGWREGQGFDVPSTPEDFCTVLFDDFTSHCVGPATDPGTWVGDFKIRTK